MNNYSPYDLLCGVQLTNPLLSLKDSEISDPKNIATPPLQASGKFSILCMPLLNSPWATLDLIFVKTISLKQKAEKLLGDETEAIVIDDLQLLKQEAELVRTDYQKCVINLSEEWRSSLIGIIPSSYDSTRYVYPLERYRNPGFKKLRMFLERRRSFSTFFSTSLFIANLEIRKT
jgi:hypothetical protein